MIRHSRHEPLHFFGGGGGKKSYDLSETYIMTCKAGCGPEAAGAAELDMTRLLVCQVKFPTMSHQLQPKHIRTGFEHEGFDSRNEEWLHGAIGSCIQAIVKPQKLSLNHVYIRRLPGHREDKLVQVRGKTTGMTNVKIEFQVCCLHWFWSSTSFASQGVESCSFLGSS